MPYHQSTTIKYVRRQIFLELSQAVHDPTTGQSWPNDDGLQEDVSAFRDKFNHRPSVTSSYQPTIEPNGADQILKQVVRLKNQFFLLVVG